MPTPLNIELSWSEFSHARLRCEVCEHKGIGHPDSICDGVAEAVSLALCAAYLQAYGEVRHHNVDKALLIGGQSEARLGGGRVVSPIRLIVAGRADALPGSPDVASIVCSAARNYIAAHLRCPADLFEVESAVRTGSPSLRRVMPGAAALPQANDTSFGTGFAPYSLLEQTVLDVAALLASTDFRAAFPVAGDDFKVMGARIGERIVLTLALAFIGREVGSIAHYFGLKAQIVSWLAARIRPDCEFRLNALDDLAASDESGIYLTVTGLSAEHGDDGQVGRANRVSRLITPSRAMSLEAVAGKNPVSHVGKIYNVLATELARALVAQVPGIGEAEVQVLSCIGRAIDRPELVDIRMVLDNAALSEAASRQARAIATEHFAAIGSLTQRLVQGRLRLF